MYKAELIEKIAECSNLTKKDAEAALNGFVTVVTQALAEGEKVQITNFGTFETRDRAARKGRNPRQPEQEIEIPASRSAVFKQGKHLKEAVKEA